MYLKLIQLALDKTLSSVNRFLAVFDARLNLLGVKVLVIAALFAAAKINGLKVSSH